MTVRLSQRDPDTTACVRALLAGVIDYAGLFPPAELDMPHTVNNYADYMGDGHAWMLGRLIVPAGRLEELAQHAGDLFPRGEDAEPWHISALVAPAGDPGLQADLDRVEAFNRTHSRPAQGLAAINMIELRAAGADAIEQVLDQVPDAIFPFFELPVADDPRGLIAAIAGSDAGAKVRTGGVHADAYPQPDQLARFIVACAASGVPFKATAGLHHPLRHYSEAVQTDEFGFLNVFVAAALAATHGLGAQEVADVLVERDAQAFTFEPDGLGYGNRAMTVEQIERTRQRFAVSFGSCSFTEPLEDLADLGLL